MSWLCALSPTVLRHDLVHQTLRLQRWWSSFWLSTIELLSLRSGTAYRLSHLHHHRHFLDQSDVEFWSLSNSRCQPMVIESACPSKFGSNAYVASANGIHRELTAPLQENDRGTHEPSPISQHQNRRKRLILSPIISRQSPLPADRDSWMALWALESEVSTSAMAPQRSARMNEDKMNNARNGKGRL